MRDAVGLGNDEREGVGVEDRGVGTSGVFARTTVGVANAFGFAVFWVSTISCNCFLTAACASELA